MSFLEKGCYTYGTSHEVYGPTHYYDVCRNASFMGLTGEYTCEYRKYGGHDQLIDSGTCTESYGVVLTPVQFFRMARQIMDFCNREFQTNYNSKFAIPSWVRPMFPDEQEKYVDVEFPLQFTKIERYDFSNGAKDWRDAILYYTYRMTVNRFCGYGFGEHNKSYYIGLAEGFNEYIANGCKLPKDIESGHADIYMQWTERKFGKVDLSRI